MHHAYYAYTSIQTAEIFHAVYLHLIKLYNIIRRLQLVNRIPRSIKMYYIIRLIDILTFILVKADLTD